MPLTILVADDDRATRLVIGDYLKLSGYSIVLAENGRDALDLVEKYQPHLIITDIAMPEMNGYDFVEQVRTRPAFRLIPVIFLTALSSTAERIKGYQLGCDNYLPKPFEIEELGVIVRALIERYALIAAQSSPLFSRQEGQLFQGEKMSSLSSWPGNEEQTMALSDTSEKGNGRVSSRANSEQVRRNSVYDSEMKLSEREQEVLILLIDGLSNAEIGDRLYLSPRTVEKYVGSLLRKTESKNRAELVRFAMEHHLVS